MSEAEFKKWMKERDAVLKSYDLDRFKKFYTKWMRKGLYRLPIPSDEVIAIAMRKAVCVMQSASESEKVEAREWLLSNGYASPWLGESL